MPAKWRALADACGGVEALREAIGVSTMTLWRWAHRGVPYVAQAWVTQLSNERGVPSPVVVKQWVQRKDRGKPWKRSS
jgi:hypothetical protein